MSEASEQGPPLGTPLPLENLFSRGSESNSQVSAFLCSHLCRFFPGFGGGKCGARRDQSMMKLSVLELGSLPSRPTSAML